MRLEPSLASLASVAAIPGLRDGSDPAVTAALVTAGSEKPQPTGSPLSAFRFTRVGDLLTEQTHDEKWLWDGILSEGGLSLLAGKPKAGKSVLVRNLAYHIARGLPFLGRQCRQGRVVYLAFEESRKGVKRHFELMGCDGTDEILIHVGPRFGGDADDPGRLLLNIATTYKPALIVIDTFSKLFHIRDINKDYTAVSRALEIPMQIGREGRMHILSTHHAGKGEKGEPIDQIIGTTALAGAVDTILILERQRSIAGDGSTLTSIQRYGDEPDPMTLALDEKSEVFSLNETDRARVQEREETKIKEIIAFVSTHSAGWSTEKEIRAKIPGRDETIRRLLGRIVAAGRVTASGSGKKGDPVRYSLPTIAERKHGN